MLRITDNRTGQVTDVDREPIEVIQSQTRAFDHVTLCHVVKAYRRVRREAFIDSVIRAGCWFWVGYLVARSFP